MSNIYKAFENGTEQEGRIFGISFLPVVSGGNRVVSKEVFGVPEVKAWNV